MKELIEKYVVDKFGNIDIPESEEEKQKLARALLGISLISNLDNWLSSAFDVVDNPEPETPFTRENAASKKDKAFRTAFASLDSEVKEKIKKLIADTTTGVLFSTLVSVDQFDFGELQIKLVPKTLSGATEEWSVTNKQEDLHDELPEWIENFSRHQEQL
jgi:alkanesulfonate monooxygenase SsuD/methylene tetrahydromethanopterin reductase-like flavin-dependent oxidoreductase (luciferase family)